MELKKKNLSWNDISLSVAKQIFQYKWNEDNPKLLENEVKILSIVKNIPEEEILNENPKKIIDEWNKLSFIKELPKVNKKYVTSLKLKGYGKVKLKNFNELELGEMIDIEEWVKNDLVNNYENILAVLFKKHKFSFSKLKWIEVEDTPEEFKRRSQAFLNLPFTEIYNIIHFFLSIVKRFIKDLGDSSTEKLKKKIKNPVKD